MAPCRALVTTRIPSSASTVSNLGAAIAPVAATAQGRGCLVSRLDPAPRQRKLAVPPSIHRNRNAAWPNSATAAKGAGEAPLNLDVRVYRQEMERSIYSWANGLKRDIGTTEVTFQTDGFDAKADWLVHPQHLVSFGVNAREMTGNPDRMLASPPRSYDLRRQYAFPECQHQGAWLLRSGRHAFRQTQPAGRPALRHGQGRRRGMKNGTVTSGLDSKDSVSGSLGAIYEAAPLFRPYPRTRPRLPCAGHAQADRDPACATTVISTPAARKSRPRRPISSRSASRGQMLRSTTEFRLITTRSTIT